MRHLLLFSFFDFPLILSSLFYFHPPLQHQGTVIATPVVLLAKLHCVLVPRRPLRVQHTYVHLLPEITSIDQLGPLVPHPTVVEGHHDGGAARQMGNTWIVCLLTVSRML